MAHVLEVPARELGHPVPLGIDVKTGDRSAHGARELVRSGQAHDRRRACPLASASACGAISQKSSMNGAAISATPMTTSHVTLLTKYG